MIGTGIRAGRLSKWITAACLIASTTGLRAQEIRTDVRPNILLILTDDQRADTLGVAGNDGIDTPNIDRLASRGARFTSAYCQGSMNGAVCLPSRSMILSGSALFDRASWSGAIRNDDLPLFPERLREAGYVTFHTGKFHSGRPWFRRCFDQGTGVFFGGMGSHFTLPVVDVVDDETFTDPYPINGHSSSFFTDAMVEFIGEHDEQVPFFAEICFTAPHDPRTPTEASLEGVDPDRIRLPGNYLPLHPFHNGEMTIRDEELSPWPRTEEEVRKQIRLYHAMIEDIDHQVGRLLEALESTGRLDETMIIFASDHGLAVGSHGLMGKQNLYEHSMRAPLIAVGDGFEPESVRDEFVYLHDIAPTVLEWAGLETTEDARALQKSSRAPREHIMLAYKDLMRSIRVGDWKLIWYPPIERFQLFDLGNDPEETVDLSTDEAFHDRLESMQDLLSQSRAAHGDTVHLKAVPGRSAVFDHAAADSDRNGKSHWKRR
jgi:arylsulfatase A-like enzyme